MLACQLRNLFQLPPRIERPSRIVGINQHNATRPRCNLPANVVDVRLPRVILIEIVKIQRNLQLREHSRIQWIVRARRQHVLARIQQRRQAKVDSFANALRDKHTLDVGDLLACSLVANGDESLVDPQRRRVAIFPVAHRLMHSVNHVRRRSEIKTQRIANIQRQNLVAVTGELVGEDGHISNGVAHVFEALRSRNLADVSRRHRSTPCSHCTGGSC